jgi:hypothetical protein
MADEVSPVLWVFAHHLPARMSQACSRIQALPEADRKHIMTTVNALLRDAKARSAYA